MFGELVGAWLAQVWADQGRPAPFVLAELGPGRGTLMRDALRAAAAHAGLPRGGRSSGSSRPARRCAPRQAETLAGARAALGRPASTDLPDRPADSSSPTSSSTRCPIRQFQRADALWRERHVGLDGDGLGFLWGRAAPRRRPRRPLPAACPTAPSSRSAPQAEAVAARARRRASPRDGGAALIIDYGAWDGTGDTLQALAGHAPADPLAAPGEADLTAHVRFRAARRGRAPGRAPSARWRRAPSSRRLGITARARALARGRRRRRGRGDRRRASPLDPPGRNGKPLPGAGAAAGRRAARRRDLPDDARNPDL